jgi:aminopeptidase N
LKREDKKVASDVFFSATTHAGSHTFTLKVKQYTKPSPGQEDKVPVLIPLAVGLLGPDGESIRV